MAARYRSCGWVFGGEDVERSQRSSHEEHRWGGGSRREGVAYESGGDHCLLHPPARSIVTIQMDLYCWGFFSLESKVFRFIEINSTKQ